MLNTAIRRPDMARRPGTAARRAIPCRAATVRLIEVPLAGGWRSWNGCPPGYTVQGGNCAPYQGPVGGGWRTARLTTRFKAAFVSRKGSRLRHPVPVLLEQSLKPRLIRSAWRPKIGAASTSLACSGLRKLAALRRTASVPQFHRAVPGVDPLGALSLRHNSASCGEFPDTLR